MVPEKLGELLARLDSLTSEIEPQSEAKVWSELFGVITDAENLVPRGYKGVDVEFRVAKRRLERLRSKKRFNESWKDERGEIRHIFSGRIPTEYENWRAAEEGEAD